MRNQRGSQRSLKVVCVVVIIFFVINFFSNNNKNLEFLEPPPSQLIRMSYWACMLLPPPMLRLNECSILFLQIEDDYSLMSSHYSLRPVCEFYSLHNSLWEIHLSFRNPCDDVSTVKKSSTLLKTWTWFDGPGMFSTLCILYLIIVSSTPLSSSETLIKLTSISQLQSLCN